VPVPLRGDRSFAAIIEETRLTEELALLAKALGHPARVQILRVLLASESCFCGEIVDQMTLAQATVSQHLKVLKDAGLIQGEIDGPRTCYWVAQERLVELHGLVGELLDEAVELSEDRRRGCS
jgi:ArsR family transcriptional regulator, arsenate/arsenite/antimonite-responsive transcriptional repressor